MTDYSEVVDFLSDPRQNVCEVAGNTICALCCDAAFVSYCGESDNFSAKLCRQLLHHLGSSSQLSTICLTALVNLSSIPSIVKALLQLSAVRHLMDNLRDQDRREAPLHQHLNVMLLANLTREPSGKLQFLGVSNEDGQASTLSSLFIQRLTNAFIAPHVASFDGTYPDQYLWVGYILVNITSISSGQRCLLWGKTNQQATELINTLCQQCFGGSLERRSSVLQVLLHLVVDPNHHSLLAGPDCLVLGTVCSLVYPPKGQLRSLQAAPPLPQQGGVLREPPASGRAAEGQDDGASACANPSEHRLGDLANVPSCQTPDPQDTSTGIAGSPSARYVDPFIDQHARGPVPQTELRQKVFDIIQLLGRTDTGRERMRAMGVYEVLRVWHLLEKEEEIRSGIEGIVHLLVYSEDELRQQDQRILRAQTASGK